MSTKSRQGEGLSVRVVVFTLRSAVKVIVSPWNVYKVWCSA